MLVGMLAGLMFLAGGWFMRLRLRDGEVVTDGVVVASSPYRQYATRYYRVEAEFKDRTATRRRFVLEAERVDKARGTRIRIGHLPQDPEGTARRVDGSELWTPRCAMGLGAWALVMSAAGAFG